MVKIIGLKSTEWTLACKSVINKDIVVEIPQLEVALHRKSSLTNTQEQVEPDSPVRKVVVQLPTAALDSQISDASQLLAYLGKGVSSFNLAALQALPRVVRQERGLITAVIKDNQVLMVEIPPISFSQSIYQQAAEIAVQVKHVELSARADFQQRFIDALAFE